MQSQYEVRIGGKQCSVVTDLDDQIQDQWHKYSSVNCIVGPITAGRHDIDINVKAQAYDVRMGTCHRRSTQHARPIPSYPCLRYGCPCSSLLRAAHAMLTGIPNPTDL